MDRAVINYMDVSWPKGGMTCPLKYVLVFFGVDSPEFPDIETFFNTHDSDSIIRAAKETGYSLSLHDD